MPFHVVDQEYPYHLAYQIFFGNHADVAGILRIDDIIACHKIPVLGEGIGIERLSAEAYPSVSDGDICPCFKRDRPAVKGNIAGVDGKRYPFAGDHQRAEILNVPFRLDVGGGNRIAVYSLKTRP